MSWKCHLIHCTSGKCNSIRCALGRNVIRYVCVEETAFVTFFFGGNVIWYAVHRGNVIWYVECRVNVILYVVQRKKCHSRRSMWGKCRRWKPRGSGYAPHSNMLSVFCSAGLPCLPRVWWGYRVRVHIPPHGAPVRRLSQEGQAGVRHLPCAPCKITFTKLAFATWKVFPHDLMKCN